MNLAASYVFEANVFSRPSYKDIGMSSMGDVINNIRYIWQQMKNDNTMRNAVYMYYNTTGLLLWLPLISAMFYAYHRVYQLFPYTASSFLLGFVALFLLCVGIYLWMSNVVYN